MSAAVQIIAATTSYRPLAQSGSVSSYNNFSTHYNTPSNGITTYSVTLPPLIVPTGDSIVVYLWYQNGGYDSSIAPVVTDTAGNVYVNSLSPRSYYEGSFTYCLNAIGSANNVITISIVCAPGEPLMSYPAAAAMVVSGISKFESLVYGTPGYVWPSYTMPGITLPKKGIIFVGAYHNMPYVTSISNVTPIDLSSALNSVLGYEITSGAVTNRTYTASSGANQAWVMHAIGFT